MILDEWVKGMADKKEPSELERVWSVISHDLTTPLLTIQLGLQHLDETLIPQLLEVYQKAKDAGLDIPLIPRHRLEIYQKTLPNTKSVVDRVRQLVSRWNRKLLPEHFQPSKQPVDIKACVIAAIEHYQTAHDLEDKSRIRVDAEEGTVLGDEATIQHILYELFANAEYAAGGSSDENANGPIVSLSSTLHEKQYQLHIKSTGAPIADADLPKLFDPYFTTKSSHLGLGLTFCQWAMQNMQGDITCRTENDGKTTIVTLTFPCE